MSRAYPEILLLYAEGCPLVDATRKNLRDAIRSVGAPLVWREVDLNDPKTPLEHRRYPSPTVLVDGRPANARVPAAAGERDLPPGFEELRSAIEPVGFMARLLKFLNP